MAERQRLRSRILELEKDLETTRSKLADLDALDSSLQTTQEQADVRPAPILKLPIEIIQQVAKYLDVPNLYSYNRACMPKGILSLYRTCRQMRLNLQSVINNHTVKHGRDHFSRMIDGSPTKRVPRTLPGDEIVSFEIKQSVEPVLSLLDNLEVPVVLSYDYRHSSPLLVAVDKGRMDLIDFFVDRNPLLAKDQFDRKDIEANGTKESLAADEKGTALQIALTAPAYKTSEKRLEIAKYLLDKGADVNVNKQAKRLFGWKSTLFNHAPIAIAAERSDIDLIKLLLEYGADVNLSTGIRYSESKPSKQPTALQISCARGNIEVFTTLLKAGADIEAPAPDVLSDEAHGPFRSFNGNALCILALKAHETENRSNRFAMAKILLEKGAAVEPRKEKLPSEEWCNIPLFHAVWPPPDRISANGFGALQMTILLLGYGANKKRVQQIIRSKNTKTRCKRDVMQCVDVLFKLAEKYEDDLPEEEELCKKDTEFVTFKDEYQGLCERAIRRPRGIARDTVLPY